MRSFPEENQLNRRLKIVSPICICRAGINVTTQAIDQVSNVLGRIRVSSGLPVISASLLEVIPEKEFRPMLPWYYNDGRISVLVSG